MAARLSIPLLAALLGCLVAASPAAAAGSLVAPPSVCPEQEELGASVARQEWTMACMVGYARHKAGLGWLAEAASLQHSAFDKSADIVRCDSFSHFACGREFAYWIKASGYTSTRCWRVGENLARGTGSAGSVRSIFLVWLNSAEHRANILGHYEDMGLSLRIGSLDGHAETRVWVEHFGSHCR